MAQKSGFFNAIMVDGQYDRKYNAEDYSENLAVVISNGVLRSENDDLKVTSNGLVVTVAAGYGWINGKYYRNTSDYTFDAISAPTGGNRYDRIVLRLNTNVSTRVITLAYLQGVAAATPTKPALTRSGGIYELCLADLYITANASGMTVTDTRSDPSVCGWVYSTSGDGSFFTSLDNEFDEWFEDVKDTLSSVTLFKRYTDEITLANAATTVAFTIPQYDADTCFIEVYVNGIFDDSYTLSSNVLTFSETLNAGAVVTVNCYKSIDGTGIMTVSGEITQLQNQYATLAGVSDFVYTCTGANDNISLSEIAQAFLTGSYTVGSLSAAAEAFLTEIGGNAFLAAFPSDGQATIKVVGTLGATSAFGGSGSSVSPYQWFTLGGSASGSKKIVFDFAQCTKIAISCAANSSNVVFYGADLYVKNATVKATGANASTNITMCSGATSSGLMNFDDCRFNVDTTGTAIIAENGTFNGCTLFAKSSLSNAYCIDAKTDALVRLNGGTFYAYAGSTSYKSAIVNVEATETEAAVSAFNVCAPKETVSGFYQDYLANAQAGVVNFVGAVTTLTNNGGHVFTFFHIQEDKQ